MALAESWDDGAPACNRYAYSFGAVSLAGRPGGEWSRLHKDAAQVLQDPGARVVPARNGFVAVTAPPPLRPGGPPPSVVHAPSAGDATASAPVQPRRLEP